jgi:hypothetical protein
MRVRVEKPDVEQLVKKSLLADGNERPDLLRAALSELDPVHPLRDEHTSGAEVSVHSRDVNVGVQSHQLLHLDLIGSLVEEICEKTGALTKWYQEAGLG